MPVAARALTSDTPLPRLQEPIDVVEQCLQFSVLRGRKAQGLWLTPTENRTLQDLEQDNRGDVQGQRASYRFATFLPAIVETADAVGRGMVLNFSAGGLYVACDLQAEQGSTVQVRIGSGSRRYLLSATVRHTRPHKNLSGLGLQIIR